MDKPSQREFAELTMKIGTNAVLKQYGWRPYYHGWIKQSWMDNKEPYDRMAVPLEQAIKTIVKPLACPKPHHEDDKW